jgi:hypothetical protein
VTGPREPAEAGPGILETAIVLGGAILFAVAIVAFLGGPLADVISVLMDAAHGGR